jgi:hypothetical protein
MATKDTNPEAPNAVAGDNEPVIVIPTANGYDQASGAFTA